MPAGTSTASKTSKPGGANCTGSRSRSSATSPARRSCTCSVTSGSARSRGRGGREELADAAGKTLLHLQCHFGLGTLSWARRGAVVTGVDFSPKAIALARSLATEVASDARFVESNVYALPAALSGRFDIVFTSYV